MSAWLGYAYDVCYVKFSIPLTVVKHTLLTMNPLFTAWLIDPYTESIQPVELTDSLFVLSQWVGSTEVGFFLRQPNGERAIMNNDMLTDPPLPPAWVWKATGDTYYGRGLWVCLNELGRLQTPVCSRTWLAGQIEFKGFTDLTELDLIEGDEDDREDDWQLYLDEPDD